MNQVHSVEARIALDLRIGAAFTRLQTLALQNRFGVLKENVVSYGTKKQPPFHSYVIHVKSQDLVSFLPWDSLLFASTKSKPSGRKPSGTFTLPSRKEKAGDQKKRSSFPGTGGTCLITVSRFFFTNPHLHASAVP